jgi:YbbR domain-containing protein
MRFLREWVLHNWALKLLALLLAVLLWAVFTTEPPVEVGYVVPLEFRNLPQNVEVSADAPTQVRVRVRGRSSLLRRLTPADLAISVDMTNAPPGEMLVRLSTSHMDIPYGAELVRIAPSEIRLRIVARQPPH